MTMTLVKIMPRIVTLTICRILVLVIVAMLKVNVVFVLAFKKLVIRWVGVRVGAVLDEYKEWLGRAIHLDK